MALRKIVTAIMGLGLIVVPLAGCTNTAPPPSSSYDDSDVYTDDDVPDLSGQTGPVTVDMLGERICDRLRGGMTRDQAAAIFESSGISAYDAAHIMAAAAAAYCPDQIGNL